MGRVSVVDFGGEWLREFSFNFGFWFCVFWFGFVRFWCGRWLVVWMVLLGFCFLIIVVIF